MKPTLDDEKRAAKNQLQLYSKLRDLAPLHSRPYQRYAGKAQDAEQRLKNVEKLISEKFDQPRV